MSNRIDINRLRELCAKDLNPIQIATRLGATPNAVYKACERHKLSAVVVKGYESRAVSFARRALPRIANVTTDQSDKMFHMKQIEVTP